MPKASITTGGSFVSLVTKAKTKTAMRALLALWESGKFRAGVTNPKTARRQRRALATLKANIAKKKGAK